MSKRVTIQDIADALGISRNTVSKAINNSDGLADATREKVLQKAIEMGYKQFAYLGEAGINLPADESEPHPAPEEKTEIALLTAGFLSHSHFASLMLDRFEREIASLGYHMNRYRITDADIASKALPPYFNPDRVAAILCVEMFDWDYDMMLCELGLPILFVDAPPKTGGRTLPADQIYMENMAPITQLVNEFISRGYEKLCFVGEYEHCQSFYERYQAFCLAMMAAGRTVGEKEVITYKNGNDLHQKIEDLGGLPDVFVCANDFVTWDTMQALAAIGKRAPEDVLISGFDDSAESRFSRPTMTTVHIHTQIIAISAVHLLLSRMKEPTLDYRTVHTETEIIYRESTERR